MAEVFLIIGSCARKVLAIVVTDKAKADARSLGLDSFTIFDKAGNLSIS